MSLTVLEPGIESRIVDLGRPRTRRFGLPIGGAADRRSLILGNSLLGNPPEAAALEIALKGPRLRAERSVGCVLFGAPFAAHLDGYPLVPGRSFTVGPGHELHVGGVSRGARAYLCVCGGFKAPMVLASQSGLEPVRKGDVLPCANSEISVRFCADLDVSFPEVWDLSILPGLQASWFDDGELFNQTFAVTPASNRMGLRLAGKPLTMPDREMISEAVCPGSIQVTRDGQCIILGVDGQTIGGYPKIAQVIHADLDSLGQMRPGQRVRFTPATLDVAAERDRLAQVEVRNWSLRLRHSL